MKLVCRACNKEKPAHQLSQDPRTGRFVCNSCMSVSTTKETSHIERQIDLDALRQKRKKDALRGSVETISYVCPHCSFKAKLSTEKMPKDCGYCGRPINLGDNRVVNAKQILDDVTEIGR